MNVVVFPTDRARRTGEYEASPNGNCPTCQRAASVMLNVQKWHWCVCENCRTCWKVGWNLYSGWQHETEADWRRNRAYLNSYREVEPLGLPYGRGRKHELSAEDFAHSVDELLSTAEILPPEVIAFILASVRGTRARQSVLLRVAARSKFTGRPITEGLAREVLEEMGYLPDGEQ